MKISTTEQFASWKTSITAPKGVSDKQTAYFKVCFDKVISKIEKAVKGVSVKRYTPKVFSPQYSRPKLGESRKQFSTKCDTSFDVSRVMENIKNGQWFIEAAREGNDTFYNFVGVSVDTTKSDNKYNKLVDALAEELEEKQLAWDNAKRAEKKTKLVALLKGIDSSVRVSHPNGSGIHQHDCHKCMYMGTVIVDGDMGDVYFCKDETSLIFRTGKHGDYRSMSGRFLWNLVNKNNTEDNIYKQILNKIDSGDRSYILYDVIDSL